MMRLVHQQRGASGVEYALLILLIAAVIFGGVALLSDEVSGFFTDTQTTFEDEINP